MSPNILEPPQIDTQRDYFQTQQNIGRLTAYYDWIFELFQPHIRPGRLLDFGCGNGHMLPYLAPYGNVLGVDMSPQSIEHIRRCHAGNPAIQARLFNATAEPIEALGPGTFDTILTSDVAEHIEDDRAFFQALHSLLRPGGVILVKVPAMPILYGSIDIISAHFRRYGAKQLRGHLQQAGFSICELRYMNVLAVLPYLFKCKLLRQRRNFSHFLSPTNIRFYNRVVAAIAGIERHLPLPIGLSLIAVGRK